MIFVSLLALAFLSCKEQEDGAAMPASPQITQEVETFASCVTDQEYRAASESERHIIDRLDAAVAALRVMQQRTSNGRVCAVVGFSEAAPFLDGILFLDGDEKPEGENVCKACSKPEAAKCIMQIANDTKNKKEFNVHVERDGDCTTFTW